MPTAQVRVFVLRAGGNMASPVVRRLSLTFPTAACNFPYLDIGVTAP